MKIVFWSNEEGPSGTTSNLTAVALMTTMMYDCKTLIMKSSYEKDQSFIKESTKFPADIIFIDGGNKKAFTFTNIFPEADLIVVSFNQSRRIMNQFFENHQNLLHKSVFILSCYDPYSRNTKERVNSIYRIDNSRMGIIPYNVKFQNAFYKEKTARFLFHHFNCNKSNENYYFMEELKKTSNMILERAGFLIF